MVCASWSYRNPPCNGDGDLCSLRVSGPDLIFDLRFGSKRKGLTVTEPGPDFDNQKSKIKDVDESPRHGNQGNRAPPPAAPSIPASLTIAVSRETGSRGGTIAHRAARK